MFQVGTNGSERRILRWIHGSHTGRMAIRPGGTYLTGSVCQNIVSRTSNGPGAFGFDPSTLSTSTPTTTIPYVYYPYTSQLGGGGYMTTNPLYNGNTQISRSILRPRLAFGLVLRLGWNQHRRRMVLLLRPISTILTGRVKVRTLSTATTPIRCGRIMLTTFSRSRTGKCSPGSSSPMPRGTWTSRKLAQKQCSGE